MPDHPVLMHAIQNSVRYILYDLQYPHSRSHAACRTVQLAPLQGAHRRPFVVALLVALLQRQELRYLR